MNRLMDDYNYDNRVKPFVIATNVHSKATVVEGVKPWVVPLRLKISTHGQLFCALSAGMAKR